MAKSQMSKTEWLKTEPPEEELAVGEGGRFYIPIGIIEKLLDELTNGDWGVENFVYTSTRHDTAYLATGSCELIVCYEDWAKRRISGSKTFQISGSIENKDFSGSALSHAISSAATKLGNRFGRALNDRLEVKKEYISDKKTPDLIALQKMENAIKNDDFKTITELEAQYNFPKYLTETNVGTK